MEELTCKAEAEVLMKIWDKCFPNYSALADAVVACRKGTDLKAIQEVFASCISTPITDVVIDKDTNYLVNFAGLMSKSAPTTTAGPSSSKGLVGPSSSSKIYNLEEKPSCRPHFGRRLPPDHTHQQEQEHRRGRRETGSHPRFHDSQAQEHGRR